jgi:hypothetical protein
MQWPDANEPEGAWPEAVNTDLSRLVAAAADLCRKPLRHAVVTLAVNGDLDRCFCLQVRTPEGERLPDEDLDLEIYRSGEDLHLTLAWTAFEERPMLWQGNHPVWMEGSSGARCERPSNGLPLEALARRLRALLAAPP